MGVFGQLVFVFGQGFLAFAGQYQRGFTAGGVDGLQVAQAVADQPGFGRVGFEAFEDVANHAGLGFAAVAVVGGGVRAEPDAVDGAARLYGEAVHFGVHFGQVLDGEVFAADAGLVGGDGDGVTCLGEEGDGVHAAFYGYPFVGGFDEVVAVLVDDAVAVEDDEFHGCS